MIIAFTKLQSPITHFDSNLFLFAYKNSHLLKTSCHKWYSKWQLLVDYKKYKLHNTHFQFIISFNSPCILFIKELQELRSSGLRCFRDIQVDEHNILSWIGLIVPVSLSTNATVAIAIFNCLFIFHLYRIIHLTVKELFE